MWAAADRDATEIRETDGGRGTGHRSRCSVTRSVNISILSTIWRDWSAESAISPQIRDMVAFASSLAMILFIRQILGEFKAPILQRSMRIWILWGRHRSDPACDRRWTRRWHRKTAALSVKAIMQMLTKYRRPEQTARSGWQNWKPVRRNVPGSNSKIKYSRVFGYSRGYKSSRIRCRIIMRKRHWPMQSAISRRNSKNWRISILAEDRLYALEYELFAGCPIK